MAILKVGIIGCGTIALLRHVPEYEERKDVVFGGFFDPIYERAKALADRYRSKTYETWEGMLADSAIDAVSVCSSNKWHATIAIAALKAGKHVLCEKPMAISLEEAEAMIQAAKQSGRHLMIGHNQRLVQAHIKAKQLLESGELGQLLTFETSFRHGGPESWGADKGVNTWFFKNDNALSGSLGDLGVHKMDLMRWLTGEEVDQVFCCQATLDKKDEQGKPVEVNDNAICVLRFKSGIMGTITTSWTCYGEETNSTVLYCTNGVMRICDNPEYSIVVSKKDKEKVFYKAGMIQTNECQTKSGVIDSFVDAIMQGRAPEISGEEGLAVLKVLFSCVESNEVEAAVKVDKSIISIPKKQLSKAL